MMKKISKLALLAAATAFLLAGFPACSDDDDDDDPTLIAVEIAVADDAKTEYTVNEPFDPTGITVTAKYSDGSTKDVTDKADFKATTGDGEQFTTETAGTFNVTLTATYGGKTAKTEPCTITVKANGDGEEEGGNGGEVPTLDGIEIAVAETVKTLYTVGEHFDPTGITVTATYSDGKTEDVTGKTTITATSGDAEFTTAAAGTYTVTLTATYGGKTTKTDPCTITVKANGSGTETPDPDAGGSTVSCLVPDEAITDDAGNGKEIEAGEAIVDSALFTITSDGKVAYSIGKNATDGVPNSSNPISVTLLDGTKKTFKQGIKQSDATDPDGTTPTKKVLVKAKEAITLRAYIALANDSFNSHRAGKIYYAIGTGEAESIAVTKRTDVRSIEVNLAKDETLTVYGILDSNTDTTKNGKLWLFGAEAKKQ